MKPALILTSLLIVLTSLSCKHSTEPEKKYKDPRNMTWTADTLPVPLGAIQVLPEDMLVVSPTNIWLATWMGHAQIFHYNGKSWDLSLDLAGGINCLTKDLSNNIWGGGYSNKIFIGYFDGFNWTRVNLNLNGEILDMSNDTKGNIWACGSNGIVLKYSNYNWVVDTVKINFNYSVEFFLKSITYHNNNIFIIASSLNKNTLKQKYFFLKGDIKNWNIIDSMSLDSPSSEIKFGNFGLFNFQDNFLFSYGLEGIWAFKNNNWEKIFNLNGEVYGMYYLDNNYILAGSAFKKIFFFNGNSWENISDHFNVNDPYFVFKNIWTNGEEIFIAGYTFSGIQKTIIFHGK